MEVKDEKLVSRMRQIIKSSDLTTTTPKMDNGIPSPAGTQPVVGYAIESSYCGSSWTMPCLTR